MPDEKRFCPGKFAPVLKIQGNFSHLRANPAHTGRVMYHLSIDELITKVVSEPHYGSNLTSARCFTKAVYEPLIKSNDKRSCSYHPFSGGLLCKKENDAGFVICGCFNTFTLA